MNEVSPSLEQIDYFNIGSPAAPQTSQRASQEKCAHRRPQPRSLESTRDMAQHKDTIERIAKAFS
ncbi:hypothetical protein D9611_012498 [Ephemerocybe angulata]|uniref:Uncharacterized protein n=1 Tax=Ephemerocybe angulata TaxID=980116 RepID=A0A8H5FIU9_9AGAR|nr:hypothetical protein D9611_012498 [Tulosesus angulatus]